MKLSAFSIRDNALAAFLRPFFAPTRGMAHRMFQDEINNAQGDMFKHPDDYELHEIGTWDDATGAFKNIGPELVVRGKDVKDRG